MAACCHRSRIRSHLLQTSKTVNLIKNEEEKKKEGIWGIKVRYCLQLVQLPTAVVPRAIPHSRIAPPAMPISSSSPG